MVQSREGVPVGGAKVTLVDARAGTRISDASSGDGIFRFRDLPPGNYQVTVESAGFSPVVQGNVALKAGELLTIEIRLVPNLPAPAVSAPERHARGTAEDAEKPELPSYRELSRRPQSSRPLSNLNPAQQPSRHRRLTAGTLACQDGSGMTVMVSIPT